MKHSTSLAARRDIAMFCMYVDTGLRESELVSLRMRDVDLEAHSARVGAQSKSRRERLVWFSGETLRELRAYLRVRGNRVSPYLWLTREGDKPSSSLILQIVKRAGRRAGMPWLTVHTLRHTAATMLLKNGMPIAHVQRILGHSRIETTMRYLHLSQDDIAEVYHDSAPLGRL